MVLFGIGGVGKTTLATELTRRALEREPTWEPVGLSGFVSADRLLNAICTRLRTVTAARNLSGVAAAVDEAARPDLPAVERLAVLRERVFPSVPVLVLLDNFEDNLADPATEGHRPLRDEALAALLAVWVEDPGESRLLFTCRYPISLPGGQHPGLVEHQVGPMSLAETRKLMWALPRLDALDASQAEQVWRMLGGHPRSLEYLDALLAGGRARFPDITKRLTDALQAKLGPGKAKTFLKPGTDLQAALTETVALAADDVLVDVLVAQIDRVPGARRFLINTSVYRRPVNINAVLFQSGQPDESAAVVPDYGAANEAITSILTADRVEALTQRYRAIARGEAIPEGLVADAAEDSEVDGTELLGPDTNEGLVADGIDNDE
jgi:hypothetical protein